MPPPPAERGQLPPQHGVKGVYYGGTWLDLEDCAGVFTEIDDKCSGCRSQDSCKDHHRRRSQSANVSDDDDTNKVYDVAIIGAGCIGAAIARELARYNLSVMWLEAADDVSQGATKGNSGIVHAGYDDTPGTNRAKFCWKGNQMFPQLDRELRFGYQLNGSMVLAMTDEDRKELQALLERGKTNGVERLRILERDQIVKMEPYVNSNVVAALYSPDAGNVIPYVSTRTTSWSNRYGFGSISLLSWLDSHCL
jgi:glycerol-3-phosphate dehydrogenase